jgi:microtubule-associated protein, RP/EB family
VYCQIIDAIHPNTVQIGKVNWLAKHDYEYAANYKILQNAFQKAGIARYVDESKVLR